MRIYFTFFIQTKNGSRENYLIFQRLIPVLFLLFFSSWPLGRSLPGAFLPHANRIFGSLKHSLIERHCLLRYKINSFIIINHYLLKTIINIVEIFSCESMYRPVTKLIINNIINLKCFWTFNHILITENYSLQRIKI